MRVRARQGLTGIYGIQCVITGAIYIGSAVDINDRFLEHLVYGVKSNKHLHPEGTLRLRPLRDVWSSEFCF